MKKKLRILYEDKHLLVVYKRNNLLTVSTDNIKEKTLYNDVYNYIKSKNKNNKIFIIHRLDRNTSGLVMFAKSEKIKKTMQDNWSNVIRKYYAVVHGKAKEEGTIKSYLKETKTFYTYSSSSGKEAITKYKRIRFNNKYSLLDINILTGRKNQIRVHMKDNNTPIVGDKKYGIKDNSRNLLLNAYYLEFNHPVENKKIVVSIDLNEEYKKYFE